MILKQFKSRFFTSVCAFAALLMAACSQDDALQTSVDNNDGLVPVTLSATIEHGVQTRATSETDDKVERCLLQIIENDGTTETKWDDVLTMTPSADGTYSATAMLNPNHTYTFLFWADGGNTYYTAEDLEAVTIAGEASEAGIAWYGSASWSSSESTTIEAELKHAVTKVTLQSTTTVPTTTTATISGVKEYSTFNVLDGKVTGETTSFTHSGKGTDEAGDVFSFYALVSDETQTLTLNTGAEDVNIPNVPLAQNKHVILSGDVANAGLTEYTFTATIDENWASSTTEGFPKIYLKGGETLTEPGDYIVTGSVTETITLSGEGITLTLDNATISVSSGNAISVESGNPTIHVVGGNNSVTSSNGAGIYVAENNTVTITSISRNNVLTARGGNGGSGIGAGCSTSCGNIEIMNVTVNAYGSSSNVGATYSAGIGGSGSNPCGTITIDNATIFAYGTSEGAAGNMSTPGIGGGQEGDTKGTYGKITIKNNSQISVSRGSWVSDYIGSAGSTNNRATSPDGIDATVDETSAIIKLN